MAADGAGGAAGRIEQHEVEGRLGRPAAGVGDDGLDAILQVDAGDVGAHHQRPLGVHLDGGHAGAGGGELHRLAAGRRAEVQHSASRDVAQ